MRRCSDNSVIARRFAAALLAGPVVLAVLVVLVVLAVLAGCGRAVPSELRVGGPHGFVRCLALEPPASRQWQVGGLTLVLEDRVLSIRGAPSPTNIAAFAGPAPGALRSGRSLVVGGARPPRLALVLGGLGDQRAEAIRTAQALASTNLLTLFVAGGRDEPEVVAAALSGLDEDQRARVLDITALERVVLGPVELVPVGGAPGGRYARTPGACGYDAADLDARAVVLGGASTRARRVLVSWAAASPALGLFGVEAGDAELARFATRIGAEDGLAAWPREPAGHALRGAARRWVVPAVGGLAVLGAEGGRVRPGPMFFTLGPSGLSSGSEAAAPR